MQNTLHRLPYAPGAFESPILRHTPEIDVAFRQLSQAVFKQGVLSRKTKQRIAVAVAPVTQCPCCIRDHTKAVAREGTSQEGIMEAIWVVAEMRAGGAVAHSVLALDTLNAMDAKAKPTPDPYRE